MASRCHGICSRLPHEKVVRWLSVQLKKLFRYCRRCELYIRQSLDSIYCKCCGCHLRGIFSKVRKKRKRDNRVHSHNYRARHKLEISDYNKKYYKKNKAKKQEYYQNNYEKARQQWRSYKLKMKLLKIFFITLYPHLLLDKNVVFN